jgi:hypothetical protein
MKNKILTIASLLLITLVSSCGDGFLEKQPLGVAGEATLANKAGVNALLIGAYSLLDGVGSGYDVYAAGSNWIYGGVTSDDAYKGSDVGDQPPIISIERYVSQPGIIGFNHKWVTVYDGISRANSVLIQLAKATDVTEADIRQISAEAKFLRGWYHFEAKKMWNMVPYIDEAETEFKVANDKDIWPMIEADFQYAAENLAAVKPSKGRASSWTAKAVLAKVHMYQQDYTAAKPLLDDVINNGPYALVACFEDNFRMTTENNSESILEVENSTGDGGTGLNGDMGNSYAFPYGGGPGGCCGFYQPSQNLVNAFKTDANGLPLLDTFNEVDVKNDEGLASTDAFTTYSGTLDPRLDWTVGRRGIPFLNWGLHPGRAWIRDQNFSGPYTNMKNVFYKGENSSETVARSNANNYRAVRFADILLMRAEVAVEESDLATALRIVNQIRTRAKNCVVTKDDGTPAANYLIGQYASFASQDYARKAVRFERRLELAQEGHRFFDLVRWGVAAEVLNKYLEKEKIRRTFLNGAIFEKGKDEYYPIPQTQIDIMGADLLKQNPL